MKFKAIFHEGVSLMFIEIDTTMKCGNCGREMGLMEFLTYVEAYFLKTIVPATIPFLLAAIATKLSIGTKEINIGKTRGVIDTSMAGLSNNFSITCPHCKQVDWYPASGKKPQKVKAKSKNVVV